MSALQIQYITPMWMKDSQQLYLFTAISSSNISENVKHRKLATLCRKILEDVSSGSWFIVIPINTL